MEKSKRLGRDFFERDGITVARELLGKVLVHTTSVGTVRGAVSYTHLKGPLIPGQNVFADLRNLTG